MSIDTSHNQVKEYDIGSIPAGVASAPLPQSSPGGPSHQSHKSFASPGIMPTNMGAGVGIPGPGPMSGMPMSGFPMSMPGMPSMMPFPSMVGVPSPNIAAEAANLGRMSLEDAQKAFLDQAKNARNATPGQTRHWGPGGVGGIKEQQSIKEAKTRTFYVEKGKGGGIQTFPRIA